MFNPAVPGSWVTFLQRSHEPKWNHPCLFPCGPKEFAPCPCAGAVNPFNPLICFFLPFVIPALCNPSCLQQEEAHPGVPLASQPSITRGTSGSPPLRPITITLCASPSVHKPSPHPHCLLSESGSVLTKSSNHREGGQHKAGVGWIGIIQQKTEGDGPQPSLTQCHKICSAVLLYGDLSTKGDPWVSLECSCVLLVLILHCACCRKHSE